MESLQEIKDKLKKVTNAWTEINSLSSTAIYDINDTNVNWNKKITFEEAEDFINQKVQIETPKPTAKDETKPKEPKKISVLGIILTIIFSITSIYFTISCINANYKSVEFANFLIYLIEVIIGIILSILGITFLIINKYKNQYNKQTLNKTHSKNTLLIISIVLLIIGVMFFIGATIVSICNTVYNLSSENEYLNNSTSFPTLYYPILILISFYIILSIGIILIVNKFSSYKCKYIEYEKSLKELEENIKYNNEQYPRDLEEYNKNYLNLCNEQVKKINATHKKIGEYFKKIAEIDIVSISQAKYAQTLLDYIYKGAISIKEAFEKLESEKEKVDKQIEEESQEIKNIENKVYENNANNEKKDKNINSKSKWKRLSKLAKSAIIVPIITIGLPIIWFIISSILQSNPENINALVGMTMIMNIISYVLIGGTAVFESVAIGILCYRKFRKDFKGK